MACLYQNEIGLEVFSYGEDRGQNRGINPVRTQPVSYSTLWLKINFKEGNVILTMGGPWYGTRPPRFSQAGLVPVTTDQDLVTKNQSEPFLGGQVRVALLRGEP